MKLFQRSQIKKIILKNSQNKEKEAIIIVIIINLYKSFS